MKADEKWYSVLIQNVQGNDYGDYYCSGTNEFGTRVAKFRLFGKFYIILKMKTRYVFDTISEDMTPRYIFDSKNNL